MTQTTTISVPFICPVHAPSCPPLPSPGQYVEPGLLERLKRRESAAQELVFRAEDRHLRSLARTHLIFDHEVAPLVADVLSDFLFQYVDALRHDRAIPSYLRIMTIRRAHRYNVRRNRERDIHDDLPEGSVHDPIEDMEMVRFSPLLRECMETLCQRDRRVLELRFGQESSLADIGAELGISKQAVANIVGKSVARLRDHLVVLAGGSRLPKC